MPGELTTKQHERTQFTRCGTIGHSWHDYDDTGSWKTQPGMTVLVFRCERCGTERRDKINRRTGELLPSGRNYIYPPGYQYSKGQRPKRDEFRLMLIALRKTEKRKAG